MKTSVWARERIQSGLRRTWVRLGGKCTKTASAKWILCSGCIGTCIRCIWIRRPSATADNMLSDVLSTFDYVVTRRRTNSPIPPTRPGVGGGVSAEPERTAYRTPRKTTSRTLKICMTCGSETRYFRDFIVSECKYSIRFQNQHPPLTFLGFKKNVTRNTLNQRITS